MKWLLSNAMESAYLKQWALLGIPAETLSVSFVHGFMYTRLRPLVRPDKPSTRPPPTFLLKIATRLHPEFRRRTAAARRTLAEPPAPPVIAEWHATLRPGMVAANLAFQEVVLEELDDADLAAHLEAVLAHLRNTFEEHFRLHCYDLGPIGQLLMAGNGWGIPSGDMLQALGGASPSTVEPLEALTRIRVAIAEAGVSPTSLAEVEAASPAAAEELRSYLRLRSSVLFSGYDLDTPTLGEAPGVILASILNSRCATATHDAEGIAAALRQRIPGEDHARFGELLHAARGAMDLRDDNGPITAEWPLGLLRLAMLEAGSRMASSGRLHDASHVFELDRAEVLALVTGSDEPGADELATRAAERSAQKELDPPLSLGDSEAPPPLDALPEPLATTVALVQTVIAELGMGSHIDEPAVGDGPRLSGNGVGTEAFVGIARVAENAEEAFDRLEPGEILVTRTTSPAYNMVLALVGGLVTAEGGPMSHAAVLSREFGIPAVIGAPDAMRAIVDGDRIEIDPVRGVVRLAVP
jgi:pyruvate,water dikinase